MNEETEPTLAERVAALEAELAAARQETAQARLNLREAGRMLARLASQFLDAGTP